MIRLEEISKKFGDLIAVDNLSLTIEDGMIFGLLGPNGAGKSTTLKMITSILKPDKGNIFIDDISLKDDPFKAKQNFGYVPDSPDMFLGMKGEDYLAFIAAIYNIDKNEGLQKTEKLAERFNIKDNLGDYIINYSHGMRQKIMIIGMLLHSPHNLILDEPLTGLDPESFYTLKEIMRENALEGKTVLLSTHVLDVAEKICDKLAIINKGKIIFTGTLEELRQLKNENSSLETLFLELTKE